MSTDVYPRKWGLGPKVGGSCFGLDVHLSDLHYITCVSGVAQEAANRIGKAGQVWQDPGDDPSRDQEGL